MSNKSIYLNEVDEEMVEIISCSWYSIFLYDNVLHKVFYSEVDKLKNIS